MMKLIRWLVVSAAIALGSTGLSQAYGQCKEPGSEVRSKIVDYVTKKYQISSSSQLVLVSSGQANPACFWKMQFKSVPAQKVITVFVSPDGAYLAPVLYDLSVDPLEEEKQKTQALAKELVSGETIALGKPSAPVTIVEFSDFQCPYCKRMTDVLEKDLISKQKDLVRVIFKNYPLPIHSWAKNAAEMAECASFQKADDFWLLHDFFFDNQSTLTAGNIKERTLAFVASEPTIDLKQFSSCSERELSLGPVMQDQQLGQRLGVHGTPTFFVNGVRYDGFHDAAEMQAIVDAAAENKPYEPASQRSTVIKQGGIGDTSSNKCVATPQKGNANELILAH